MSNRHKAFASFHHSLNQNYKRIFELRFGNAFGAIAPSSVNDGDIDPNLPTDTIRQKIRNNHLRDTSVTVVLIGAEAWQRKYIDWEIGMSIRHTKYAPRSRLVVILLPTNPRDDKSKYHRRTIPPRIHDNIESRFASIHNWPEHAPTTVKGWIHQAYLRKSTKQADYSRASFGKHCTGDAWTN